MLSIDADYKRTNIQKTRHIDWLNLGILIVHAVAVFGFFFSGSSTIIDIGTGWTQQTHLPFLASIQGFTVAQDGKPWMLVNHAIPDKDEIINISDVASIALELPNSANPIQGLDSYYWYPESLSVDSFGRPWVSLYNEGIVYWDGAQWKLFLQANGEAFKCAKSMHANRNHIIVLSSLNCQGDFEIYLINPVAFI